MPLFLLYHQHTAQDCETAFAAWVGFDSPLRRRLTTSSCLSGGHAVWWQVEVEDRDAALALVPRYVARRTTPIEVRAVRIP
jgi:hypothetical protein